MAKYSFLCFVLFVSCQNQETEKQIIPAFYFWKQDFLLRPTEEKALQNVQKLYVKFFDVDIQNRKVIPKAVLNWQQKPPAYLQIIPTIFITNQTFKNCSVAEIDSLSNLIFKKIEMMSKDIRFQEVQFDCDWSASTRNAYFYFLKNARRYFQTKQISATIRLHQVKFPEMTGIPPVDRGMLMCYNMADWKNAETRNSIYDTQILNEYISDLDCYPLDLDVAFPIFRWAVFYREGRFLQFKNHLDQKTLTKCDFVEETKPNRFAVRQDTLVFGLALRKGDLIRTESLSNEEFLAGKKQVFRRIKNKNLTFALYHLDTRTLAPYENHLSFFE